jgi:hypothetical protein
MASRFKRPVPVTVNDVLDGHVKLDLECLDRLYPLSEPRDVAAVQKAKRPLPRATMLTGMSCSAGHSGYDRSLGATESGHPVPNGSPSFSLLPLVGISHSRSAAFVKPP